MSYYRYPFPNRCVSLNPKHKTGLNCRNVPLDTFFCSMVLVVVGLWAAGPAMELKPIYFGFSDDPSSFHNKDVDTLTGYVVLVHVKLH